MAPSRKKSSSSGNRPGLRSATRSTSPGRGHDPPRRGRYVEALEHLCRVEHLYYNQGFICLVPGGLCRKHKKEREAGNSRAPPGLYLCRTIGNNVGGVPGSLISEEELNRQEEEVRDANRKMAAAATGAADLPPPSSPPPPAPSPSRSVSIQDDDRSGLRRRWEDEEDTRSSCRRRLDARPPTPAGTLLAPMRLDTPPRPDRTSHTDPPSLPARLIAGLSPGGDTEAETPPRGEDQGREAPPGPTAPTGASPEARRRLFGPTALAPRPGVGAAGPTEEGRRATDADGGDDDDDSMSSLPHAANDASSGGSTLTLDVSDRRGEETAMEEDSVEGPRMRVEEEDDSSSEESAESVEIVAENENNEEVENEEVENNEEILEVGNDFFDVISVENGGDLEDTLMAARDSGSARRPLYDQQVPFVRPVGYDDRGLGRVPARRGRGEPLRAPVLQEPVRYHARGRNDSTIIRTYGKYSIPSHVRDHPSLVEGRRVGAGSDPHHGNIDPRFRPTRIFIKPAGGSNGRRRRCGSVRRSGPSRHGTVHAWV